MNSNKPYQEEFLLNHFNQISQNCIHSEWGESHASSQMQNLVPQDELEFLFNSRYSDLEQYQVLQQSDYSPNFNTNLFAGINPINIQDHPMKWNADDVLEFESSDKQQVEEYKLQNQIHINYQNNMMKSQATHNRNQSHRSCSTSSEISARDNSSSVEKSSSFSFENKSSSTNDESSSLSLGSISQRDQKSYANDSESSLHNFSKPEKNKQSQHKNVVKNIGLGFKNCLTDSKSPLQERILSLLKENRVNHVEFRQWIIQSVKLDQKKEIYKALNIKLEDNSKIQSYKKILSQLFSIFFENNYANSYLLRNSNIKNKDIHIQFIKHFISSSRDPDYLLKKWK